MILSAKRGKRAFVVAIISGSLLYSGVEMDRILFQKVPSALLGGHTYECSPQGLVKMANHQLLFTGVDNFNNAVLDAGLQWRMKLTTQQQQELEQTVLQLEK